MLEREGPERAKFLLRKVLKRARMQHLGLELIQTPYINTISPEQEPPFPGDEEMEKRIRRIVRWNAMAMVTRANHRFPGLGGHLSTYASAAALYEVGFNHFFRGKADGGGDQIFFQGHAAPGIYARAFLEGRLTEEHLDALPPRDHRRTGSPRTRTRARCPTSGSSRRSRWGSGPSTRSTRRASTATCTTGA